MGMGREIEGKEEVLKPKYTDESMMAAGFAFLDIWEMSVFSRFYGNG